MRKKHGGSGVIIDNHTVIQRSEIPVNLDLYMQDLDDRYFSLIDGAITHDDQSIFET